MRPTENVIFQLSSMHEPLSDGVLAAVNYVWNFPVLYLTNNKCFVMVQLHNDFRWCHFTFARLVGVNRQEHEKVYL